MENKKIISKKIKAYKEFYYDYIELTSVYNKKFKKIKFLAMS